MEPEDLGLGWWLVGSWLNDLRLLLLLGTLILDCLFDCAFGIWKFQIGIAAMTYTQLWQHRIFNPLHLAGV